MKNGLLATICIALFAELSPVAASAEKADPTPLVTPIAVSLEVSGRADRLFLTQAIHDEVARALSRSSQDCFAITGVTLPDLLAPNSVLDAMARAEGRWIQVHVRSDSLAIAPKPSVYFYSDDPEQFYAPGVLYRGTIPATVARAVEVYAYHQSKMTGRAQVSLVVRSASRRGRIRLIGASNGPHGQNFISQGHTVNVDYLQTNALQQGLIYDVAVEEPTVIPLAGFLAKGDLMVAVYNVSVLEGGPMELSTIVTDGVADPRNLPTRQLPLDKVGRFGDYDLSLIPPIILVYSTLDPGPGSLEIGKRTNASGTPIARAFGPPATPLPGQYGVARPIVLNLANPTADERKVYLFATPLVTDWADATYWFDGDVSPLRTPCIGPDRSPYLIRPFTLRPYSTLSVTGVYLNDGAVTLPIQLGLTSSPPLDPGVPRDHCPPIHRN